ncbi:MAG: segregation/condensation protein A [Firmicutes bacterium]|nr:segregation/condensation protein A [Bacillota bacterium]
MAYKVKLNIFEGPFELLIYLIEHSRMSVYDIKISEITAQYLDYVKQMEEADIELAQEFMVLAAELIDIKSRMLLPTANLDPETGAAEDPRKALVARILEYKQYKDIAGFLSEQQEETEHIHTKPQEDLSRWTGETDELLKGTMDQFAKAFEAFLLRKQRIDAMRRTYERIERERISIEKRMDEIRSIFLTKKTVMFSEMIAQDKSVFNRVVSFMSLLELLKLGNLTAQQKKRYGDIKVSLKEDRETE